MFPSGGDLPHRQMAADDGYCYQIVPDKAGATRLGGYSHPWVCEVTTGLVINRRLPQRTRLPRLHSWRVNAAAFIVVIAVYSGIFVIGYIIFASIG